MTWASVASIAALAGLALAGPVRAQGVEPVLPAGDGARSGAAGGTADAAPASASVPGAGESRAGSGPGSPTAESDAPVARDGRWLVVARASPLYREALVVAGEIGRVRRGERVVFVDFIDRRLRVFGTLIFDGGHWVKIRLPDGLVGWVPASVLRQAP